MSTDKKYKKDKEIVFELETQIKDIRHQLNEQLRCLEIRLENHNGMTWELMDFYQRRAEVEYEYSRSLDKLVKSIVAKHKTEKQKRDPWQAYSTYKMWQTLLGITTKQSKNHSLLADAFNSVIMGKFSQMRDDMVRVYRKCHDMAINLHSELVRAVTELHSFMKTYHLYNGECKQSETKLHRAETQKSKVEQEKKGTLTKRFQNYDKKTEKHRTRVLENNLKALKARNEYLLSVDSANGAIRKFFVDDMPDLINAMDYGYHISLGQIMMYNVEMEEKVGRLEQEGLTLLTNKAKELNQITDRQAFLQQYHQIFSLPKKFEFQPHKGDNVSEVMCPASVREDMMSRVKTITERLHALKLENDEYWKTLETTDNALVERLTMKDFDVNMQFQQGEKDKEKLPTKSTSSDFEKQRAEFIETQNFYLNKFKSYQLNSNLIARLLSKCSAMEKATAGIKSGATRPLSLVARHTRKRHLGRATLESQPKLFGGSIEEYVHTSGQEIPLVIKSCTRIINLYGMHHQGVFRIPGLQHEITEYKNMFERGEEPVLNKVDTRDINSVAGVLKLYFRELREPLFPLQLFDELLACSKYNVEDPDELSKCISRLQELLLPLPRALLIVIRYLFAFLNHLSEYSDENMMDAFNLSVCFGPTLLPIPPDHDQVSHQNFVNELIRILIVYQERIFPNDGGLVYEKCIVEDDNDLEDSVDSLLEGAGGDGSEDDLDPVEAVALYDFQGRTGQEMSLKKGDTVRLVRRVSNEWWEGIFSGQTGLVPHKFVAMHSRRKTSSAESEERIFTSTESLPSKSSSSLVPNLSATPELLDRSFSQPNICSDLPISPTAAMACCSSTSSELSHGGDSSISDSVHSSCLKENAEETRLIPVLEETVEPAEKEIPPVSCESQSITKSTPDLVLNLPDSENVPEKITKSKSLSPSNLDYFVPITASSSSRPQSPTMTTAEVFASVGLGTIKKGTSLGRSSTDNLLSCDDDLFPGKRRESDDDIDTGDDGKETDENPAIDNVFTSTWKGSLDSLKKNEVMSSNDSLLRSPSSRDDVQTPTDAMSFLSDSGLLLDDADSPPKQTDDVSGNDARQQQDGKTLSKSSADLEQPSNTTGDSGILSAGSAVSCNLLSSSLPSSAGTNHFEDSANSGSCDSLLQSSSASQELIVGLEELSFQLESVCQQEDAGKSIPPPLEPLENSRTAATVEPIEAEKLSEKLPDVTVTSVFVAHPKDSISKPVDPNGQTMFGPIQLVTTTALQPMCSSSPDDIHNSPTAMQSEPEGRSHEGKSPDGKSPEGKSPEGKSPEGKSPEGKSPEGKSPEGKSPEIEPQSATRLSTEKKKTPSDDSPTAPAPQSLKGTPDTKFPPKVAASSPEMGRPSSEKSKPKPPPVMRKPQVAKDN